MISAALGLKMSRVKTVANENPTGGRLRDGIRGVLGTSWLEGMEVRSI